MVAIKPVQREFVFWQSCICCQEILAIKVNEEDFVEWSNGNTLAQDAFPYLSDDEREFLISALCPNCFPNGE